MANWRTSVDQASGHPLIFVGSTVRTSGAVVVGDAPDSLDDSTTGDRIMPPTGRADQVRVIAARACLGCRRLKMKCVGASNPPCMRCQKSGRRCEFPLLTQDLRDRRHSTRTSQSRNVSGSAHNAAESYLGRPIGGGQNVQRLSDPPATNNAARVPWTPLTPDVSTLGTARDSSDIPSVYSTSPFSTVVEGTNSGPPIDDENDSSQSCSVKRRRVDSHGNPTGQEVEDLDELVPNRDIEQLINVFRKRLLSYIPVLCSEDFSNILPPVKYQKPLVYCVCYVTARFLPGGSAIRSRLFPFIKEMMNGKFEEQIPNPIHSLVMLQSFMILYAYAPARPSSSGNARLPHNELAYWRIKALTEMHALQLQLHRSAEMVRTALVSSASDISKSHGYRMYTYWLWLYTMSHHSSLATRTPPSIRADAYIRMAPKLLKDVGMSSSVSRLIGEVELCLYWEKASIQETRLGEWWCLPEPGTSHDASSTRSLDEIGAALKLWSQKWDHLISAGRNDGIGLDFHLRFTRFCISTYSIRQLEFPYRDMSLNQRNSIAKSIETASSVITWALDLGPASKDGLRYMCDFGFVMLSFCCFFILRAVKASGSAIPNIARCLDVVKETAELMIELAVDPTHEPGLYGRSILSLLCNLRENRLDHSDPDPPQADSTAPIMDSRPSAMDQFEGAPSDFETFPIDTEWDFSSLFPDMRWN